MITKQITATSKSDTHLEFNVKVSIPLTEISSEMAEDCVNMFNMEFPVPVVRHLKFIMDETGKERIIINVVPKEKE